MSRSTTLVGVLAGTLAGASIGAHPAPPPARQTPATNGQPAARSTSSVSENTTGIPAGGQTHLDASGGFWAANVTLRQLVQYAYRRHLLERPLIEGGPAWIDSERFNVSVGPDGDHRLDSDGVPRQTWLMLRTLLAEQFKLKVRTEVREVLVYALVLARVDGTLGPRLRKSDVDCAEAVSLMIKGQRPRANCGFQEYVGRHVPTVLTLPDMASIFSSLLDRPVIDRTGLSGHYSADLESVEVRPPGPFDPGYGPSDVARAMFTALPAELGLRLEATTAPVEVLVIEDAANPNKPDPLPLVVERAEIVLGDAADRTSDQILITIRNAGDKTIVAWGVRAELTFADRKPFSTATSTDGVESRELVRRDSPVLSPDGRHTFRLASFPGDRAVKDVVSVTATATLVIFDDDTARGDEQTIRFHFEKRAANQRVWPIIEKVFADAMTRTADPREALVDADKGLEAISDEAIRQTNAYTGIRRDLTVNLRITRDPAALLMRLVDEIRLRREAADAHSQRRR